MCGASVARERVWYVCMSFCVRAYVYIVCIFACECMHVCESKFVSKCVCVCVCVRARSRVCVCLRASVYGCVFMRLL